jgi:hypothetical protein
MGTVLREKERTKCEQKPTIPKAWQDRIEGLNQAALPAGTGGE